MNTFRNALQRNAFTITAELSLRRQTSVDEVLEQAGLLADYVDGILVAENPLDWIQVSPVALAGLLIRKGIDAVPSLTCRDRNRIALQSDLLGMRASGVTSVMLTEGARIPEGCEPMGKPVFDINCRELVAMAHDINEEESSSVQNSLFIGTDATVFLPPSDWNAGELLARAAAGARFVLTQPCFNVEVLRQYMQGMVETKATWNYSAIVTLAPLPSAKTAAWLSDNIKDSMIPPDLVERLEGADLPEREGIEICAELMQEIAGIPGISGVNLLSLGNPEAVIAAIESFRLKANS